jgi:BirA family biotin operon repressor/biotin-[acetyl-CoA-carboxylase] ligase
VLASLWESYTAWQEGGDLAGLRLAESYAAACATIGQQVRVDLPSGEVLTGTASGIDPSGRLLVDGTAVSAGDVIHLRVDR